jgi:7-cyano-7-deazaguanine reductase
MPNASPDIDYEVRISTDEFTSLCPLNLGQPDYATILIVYSPALKTVELKSLKMYLASFRQVAIFHELVPVTIMKALRDLLSPLDLQVIGDFSVRGGLNTTVISEYHAPHRSLKE